MPTLCLWLTHLASSPRSLTLGTCKVYLAAVVTRHTELGLDNPIANAPPVLDRLIAGIKRMTARPGRQKLPITTAMLDAMRPHLSLQHRSDSLLWAMMWTATAGLLRISEFTVLNDADTARTLRARHLTLHDQRGAAFTLAEAAAAEPAFDAHHVTLHLDASKTDPFREGVDIVIAAPTATAALLQYGRHCRTALQRDATTPLFHFPGGRPVSRAWLMRQVDQLLRLTGHDPSRYSSHSFRKGGAVSLQARGVEDSLIRRTGRWKSDAFHRYVRHAPLDVLVATNARL